MVRETSVKAYQEIKLNGILTGLQLKVYETLFFCGPLTGNEMREIIGGKSNSGVYITRLSELERRGAVQTLKKRACQVTGRLAIEWDVTSHIPKGRVKPMTKKDKIKDLVNGITEMKEYINEPIIPIKREWLIRNLNKIITKVKEF